MGRKFLQGVVPLARFERTTYGLGIRCSILLSYRGFDSLEFSSSKGICGIAEGLIIPLHARTIYNISLSSVQYEGRASHGK